MKQLNKKSSELFIGIYALVCIVAVIAVFMYAIWQWMDRYETAQRELDEAPVLLEGTVQYVWYHNDTLLVSCDEIGDDYLVEVDIDWSIIHTKIEIGDTVLFVVDRQWTDADLLGVIREVDEDNLWD